MTAGQQIRVLTVKYSVSSILHGESTSHCLVTQVMKDLVTGQYVMVPSLTTGAVHGYVQQQVQTVKDYITAHFYTCTDEILAGLGKLYAAGGDFTKNIARAGGPGAAAFAARAIAWYCQQTR